jgi:glycosyltransferase involved in cell wall biosynthesis
MSFKVFFVSDQKTDWLKEEFVRQDMPIRIMCPNTQTDINKKSFNMSRTRRILYLHIKYLKVAYQTLSTSKKDDILICWLDVIAIYVLLLSKILCRKRKIVAINIMFNDNPSLLTRIKKKCMRWLLSDKSIYPTVTSTELSLYYREIFNLPKKEFFLLHDTYGLRKKQIDKAQYQIQAANNSYVFCGGTNGRDWNTLIKIADELPNLKFVIVGPHKDTLGENYPSNIDYYYNIPYDKFMELFANATVLALPLNTEAPAGLIVLLEGALLSKAIVTTDNITMREYIHSDENGYLIKKGDYKVFADKVNAVFPDTQMQKEFGEKLNETIIDKCSPEVYVATIIKIINRIKVV